MPPWEKFQVCRHSLVGKDRDKPKLLCRGPDHHDYVSGWAVRIGWLSYTDHSCIVPQKRKQNGAPRRDTCIETCGVDLAYDPTSHPPKSQSPFGKSAYSLFFLYMRAFKLGRQVAGAAGH